MAHCRAPEFTGRSLPLTALGVQGLREEFTRTIEPALVLAAETLKLDRALSDLANQVYLSIVRPDPGLNPAKYVVLNTGLTIDDRGYNGDYGTPLWGDYAIVKVKPGAAVPEMLTAGLFDEHWQLAK